jgi:hypothetical protein
MGTKDDILNSNLEVQLKGLYVQIVGEMNAKCLCLLTWYMYILHPLPMIMVYLVFKKLQFSNAFASLQMGNLEVV